MAFKDELEKNQNALAHFINKYASTEIKALIESEIRQKENTARYLKVTKNNILIAKNKFYTALTQCDNQLKQNPSNTDMLSSRLKTVDEKLGNFIAVLDHHETALAGDKTIDIKTMKNQAVIEAAGVSLAIQDQIMIENCAALLANEKQHPQQGLASPPPSYAQALREPNAARPPLRPVVPVISNNTASPVGFFAPRSTTQPDQQRASANRELQQLLNSIGSMSVPNNPLLRVPTQPVTSLNQDQEREIQRMLA